MNSRNPGLSQRRTCRNENSFENDLARMASCYPHIEKVFDDITWELSRNPRVGTPSANDPDLWIFHTNQLPSFRVLYSFDDNMVYLWAIEPTVGAIDDLE